MTGLLENILWPSYAITYKNPISIFIGFLIVSLGYHYSQIKHASKTA